MLDALVSFSLGECQDVRLGNWKKVYELCKRGKIDHYDKMLHRDKVKSVEDIGKIYYFFEGFRDKLHYEYFEKLLSYQDDKDVCYPFILVDSVAGKCPYISYNRQAHGSKYPLLWPLDYHINEAITGFKDTVSFEKKKSKIIFRGALSSAIEDKIIEGFYKSSRFIVSEKWLGHKNIDLGITKIPMRKNEPFEKYADRILKCILPPVSKENQMNCKFILCLEGADISSSLGWVLASNCVPILPYPYIYETYFFYNLRPWIHFIPCDPKCDNLELILEWSKDNEEKCKKISENGKEYARFVFDKENIEKVKKEIVKTWKMKVN